MATGTTENPNPKIKKKNITGTTGEIGYAPLGIAYADYEIISIVSNRDTGHVTMYGRWGNGYILFLAGTDAPNTIRLYSNTYFDVDVYYCERGTIPLISN